MFTVVPTYYANKTPMSKRWMNSAHYSIFTGRTLSALLARQGFAECQYTYPVFGREVDEVWHIARLTKTAEDPRRYYENATDVATYLNRINPLRSAVLAPVYGGWSLRMRVAWYAKLAICDPAFVMRKTWQKLHRMLGLPA
jgi:hypothetical protein